MTVRLALAGVALLLAGACSRAPEPAAPASPSAMAPDPVRDALRDARRALVADRGAAEANALNEPGSLEVLDKLGRQLAGLRVYERIPTEPAPDALERELARYSAGVGLTLAGFAAEAVEPAPRDLPAELVGPGKVVYEPEDLRGVLRLRFTLAPLDIGRLEPWLRGLPRGVARMVRVDAVKGAGDRLEVRARAYWFLIERVPRHRPAPRTLGATLAANGITEPPDVLQARYGAEIAELRAILADIDGYAPAIERSLGTLARANLIEARYALFEQEAREIEGIGVVDVLR